MEFLLFLYHFEKHVRYAIGLRRLMDAPHCGYPYEREPGYFLMSIWAINYGLGSLLGIILYLILEALYEMPIGYLIALVLIPIILFNFFFARHSKALFLALDLFCDPHEKEKGNDDGGIKRTQPPSPIKPKSATSAI